MKNKKIKASSLKTPSILFLGIIIGISALLSVGVVQKNGFSQVSQAANGNSKNKIIPMCFGCLFDTGSSNTQMNFGSRLAGKDLTDGYFYSLSTNGIDMSNAILVNAILDSSSLQNTNFTNVDFTDADISASQLISGNNFTSANFTNANLSNIRNVASNNFTSANFTNANLSNSAFSGNTFTGATWSNTTCADGTVGLH